MWYQGYKDALVEMQTLKLKCSSERMRSEALDAACNDLKLGNQIIYTTFELLESLFDLFQYCKDRLRVKYYLYYYIKHLRIEGSIFCHGNFLLYLFYLSIRRLIFIFG
jgi:hypothetical protein